jgi:YD repeat-containing protein
MIRAVPSISIHPRRVAFYLAAEESFFPFPPAVTHPSMTIHRLHYIAAGRPAGRRATSEKKGRSPPCVNELNSQPTNPYRRV